MAWILLGLVSRIAVADDSSAATIKILFVGNSLTYVNDVPRILQSMAIASGQQRLPEIKVHARPGASWEHHWSITNVRAQIAATPWDYVVLQEQSLRPLSEPDLMLLYGELLIGEAARRGAVPMLFLPWGHKPRPQDQAAISAKYFELAKRTRARVAPVGTAWAYAREHSPALQLYDEDGVHATSLGSYVAACVLYRAIYRAAPGEQATLSFKTFYGNDSSELERVAPVRLNAKDAALARAACMSVEV